MLLHPTLDLLNTLGLSGMAIYQRLQLDGASAVQFVDALAVRFVVISSDAVFEANGRRPGTADPA